MAIVYGSYSLVLRTFTLPYVAAAGDDDDDDDNAVVNEMNIQTTSNSKLLFAKFGTNGSNA